MSRSLLEPPFVPVETAVVTYESPVALADAPSIAVAPPAPRRRGRPLEMTPSELCAEIRRLASLPERLAGIHRRHPGLYARGRRQFGTWAAAVRAAGV